MLKLYKTAEEIALEVARVAREIDAFYAGVAEDSPVLVVCMLKGAVHFFSDLTRRLHFPMELDFVCGSSYGSGRESSGQVELLEDVRASVKGRRVLIVEDVADTGVTLDYFRRHFLSLGASDVEIAVAFDKPLRRKVALDVRFRAIELDDFYIVGYGLDDAQRYRELPDLWYVE